MKIGIFLISFILDGVFSNFFKINGCFYPLFSLISLIVSFSYFNGNYSKYYKWSFVIGLLYDNVYTNTAVLNAFLFLLVSLIIVKISTILSPNYFSLIVITLISIVFYRCVSYLCLALVGNVSFDLPVLWASIYRSIILNIIYLLILTSITDLIDEKFNIRKSSYYL